MQPRGMMSVGFGGLVLLGLWVRVVFVVVWARCDLGLAGLFVMGLSLYFELLTLCFIISIWEKKKELS